MSLTDDLARAWGLERVFAERVVRLYELATQRGITSWRIIDGFRDPAIQARYYAQGRDASGKVVDKRLVVTNAKPYESAHQWGLAIDVEANERTLAQLGALAGAAGLGWGGDWRTFKDPPHFEMMNWRLHRRYST